MRRRIRRFGILSAARMSAVLYGLMGLLFVPFLFLATMFAPSGSRGMMGMGMGLLGIIVLPLFYAAIGFVGTAIACALYNGLAGMLGGIEVEVEDAMP